MPAALRPGAQGDREGGQAEEPPFDGCRDRPGIQHVVAQILAVVDARNHHVVFVVKETGDRQMHAIRRGSGDEVHARLRLEHAQGHIQRERVAGTAAIAVRGHHRHVGERGEDFSQAADAL